VHDTICNHNRPGILFVFPCSCFHRRAKNAYHTERRAYLWGEGQKRQEWGVSLVIVNKRGGHPCPHCAKWAGKILIDDVYSGGRPDGKHTLLSEAMAQGFLHPRCKDGFTTYFPGVTSVPDPATKAELREAERAEAHETREQHAELMAEKWDRRAKYSLDPNNKRAAEARAEEWHEEAEKLSESKQPSERIAEALGISPENVKISELPEDAKNALLQSVDKVISRFPQLKGHTTQIVYDSTLNPNTIASSSSLSGKIRVGPKYLDMDNLRKKYAYNVRLGFHPKGTTAESAMTHELGHQIDGMLTKKGIYGGRVFPFEQRTSHDVQKTILEQVGFFDFIKDVRKEYVAKGYSGRDLFHAIDFEKKEWYDKNVSLYAMENEREFFAECFAEYMDSPDPRPVAQAFGRLLEEIMEGL